MLHTTGIEPLYYFCVANKDQHTAEKMIEVLPGEIKVVTPVELGNDKENPYLMVQKQKQFRPLNKEKH